jgi:thiol-disulfide isomerase/thioredoxin
VDVTDEVELTQQLEVVEWPAYKFYSNGIFRYDLTFGDSAEIVEFVKSQPVTPVAPQVSEISILEPGYESAMSFCSLVERPECEENLNELIKDENLVLVLFHGDTEECKRVLDDFGRAAEALQNENTCVLTAIDCLNLPCLCEKYKVVEHPCLRYFRKGEETEYTGGKTTEAIVAFLKEELLSVNTVAPSTFGSFPGSDKVQIINGKNYEELLANGRSTLIFFYTAWCGFCTQMKPEYAAAALRLAEEHLPCQLVAVDCTDEYELADLFSISAFPTIKYVEGKDIEKDYRGFRNADALVEFMKLMCSSTH